MCISTRNEAHHNLPARLFRNLPPYDNHKLYFMNNTAKILAAVAAGAAAGAVLGVLFAPDKGSETRRKIKEKGENMANDLKDKFRKTKERFNNMKEEAEEKMREKMEEYA